MGNLSRVRIVLAAELTLSASCGGIAQTSSTFDVDAALPALDPSNDSDCTPGQICVCGDPVGRCEDSSCNPGTCAPGFDCVEYNVTPGCAGTAFACQTPADECLHDSDCEAGGNCRGVNSPAEIRPGESRICSSEWCTLL